MTSQDFSVISAQHFALPTNAEPNYYPVCQSVDGLVGWRDNPTPVAETTVNSFEWATVLVAPNNGPVFEADPASLPDNLFDNIPAAITRATAIVNGVASRRVLILVRPGVYSENVQLPHYVKIRGAATDPYAAQITGSLTVLAPPASETTVIERVRLTGGISREPTVDGKVLLKNCNVLGDISSASADSPAAFTLRDCELASGEFVFGASGSHTFELENCALNTYGANNTNTASDFTFDVKRCQWNGGTLNLNSNSAVQMRDCDLTSLSAPLIPITCALDFQTCRMTSCTLTSTTAADVTVHFHNCSIDSCTLDFSLGFAGDLVLTLDSCTLLASTFISTVNVDAELRNCVGTGLTQTWVFSFNNPLISDCNLEFITTQEASAVNFDDAIEVRFVNTKITTVNGGINGNADTPDFSFNNVGKTIASSCTFISNTIATYCLDFGVGSGAEEFHASNCEIAGGVNSLFRSYYKGVSFYGDSTLTVGKKSIFDSCTFKDLNVQVVVGATNDTISFLNSAFLNCGIANASTPVKLLLRNTHFDSPALDLDFISRRGGVDGVFESDQCTFIAQSLTFDSNNTILRKSNIEASANVTFSATVSASTVNVDLDGTSVKCANGVLLFDSPIEVIHMRNGTSVDALTLNLYSNNAGGGDRSIALNLQNSSMKYTNRVLFTNAEDNVLFSLMAEQSRVEAGALEIASKQFTLVSDNFDYVGTVGGIHLQSADNGTVQSSITASNSSFIVTGADAGAATDSSRHALYLSVLNEDVAVELLNCDMGAKDLWLEESGGTSTAHSVKVEKCKARNVTISNDKAPEIEIERNVIQGTADLLVGDMATGGVANTFSHNSVSGVTSIGPLLTMSASTFNFNVAFNVFSSILNLSCSNVSAATITGITCVISNNTFLAVPITFTLIEAAQSLDFQSCYIVNNTVFSDDTPWITASGTGLVSVKSNYNEIDGLSETAQADPTKVDLITAVLSEQ